MSKKIIVKIILFAALLIAVLGIAMSIITDHLEKSEWSNKQAEIDDQCIYSQRSDKFGFKFYYDSYENTGFKMQIFQSYKRPGAEYINMEEGLKKFISIKAEEIITLSDEPKTEFARLDLTYSDILNRYTVGDFGIFKWASETAAKNIENIQKEYEFFLWQDKYLVCIYKKPMLI